MATFKTFFKAEEAYVVASLLESEGIEATVIDESAYGGSLLGSTVASIRIEVPESQLLQAQEVVDSAEALKTEETATQTKTKPDTKLQEIFRKLVVIDVAIYAIYIVLTPRLFHIPPTDSEAEYWLYSLAPSSDFSYAVSLLWIPALLMRLISSVLLFVYVRIGCGLYIGVVGWNLLGQFAYPPMIPNALGGILGGISWMLTSALVTLIFIPEVADRFRKHVGKSV